MARSPHCAARTASRIRTKDEATINRWFAEADYNIAIVPEDAGWCAVDVDNKPLKEGGTGLDVWAGLIAGRTPTTRTIRTPSGGLHLYFYGSLPSSVRRLGPGIDTRGRDGYVLISPSVLDDKLYTVEEDAEIADLPVWIAEAIDRVETPPREAPPEGVALDTPYAIETARAWLKTQPVPAEGAGSDAQCYRAAALLKDWALSQDTIALELMQECGAAIIRRGVAECQNH